MGGVLGTLLILSVTVFMIIIVTCLLRNHRGNDTCTKYALCCILYSIYSKCFLLMEAQYFLYLKHQCVSKCFMIITITIRHTANLLGVQWIFQLVQMRLMNYPSSLHSSRKLYISEMF